jgi:hypothetical protein
MNAKELPEPQSRIVHGGLARSVGPRSAQPRRDRTRLEDEAKLVPRVIVGLMSQRENRPMEFD